MHCPSRNKFVDMHSACLKTRIIKTYYVYNFFVFLIFELFNVAWMLNKAERDKLTKICLKNN